jgi:polyhydroxyalkanoate synthesis regulator phasin
MPQSQFRNFEEDLIKEDTIKQSVYEADSQKNIRDMLSFIVKHNAEEQKAVDTGL